MTWGLIAVGVIGAGSAYMSKRSGDKAAAASTEGAQTAADAQLEGLNYLKETEEIPQQFRQEALTKLGGVYGLEGGEGSQEDLIRQAIESPLYKSIMGTKKSGEESILRTGAATGGLRSGNMIGNLYDYNIQLENKALLDSYNQQLMGLTGLAQLPSAAGEIAEGTARVGETLSMGQIAAAQAKQAGTQNMMNSIMGVANLGISAYGAGMFSDRRLKENIKLIGHINGLKWYSFDWNSIANKLGLFGSTQGTMADEVFKLYPKGVTFKNDFLFVKYDKIGVAHA